MSAFKIKATSGGGGTEVPPAGNHPAILVAIIDLGTQETSYKDTKSWIRKVYLIWELTTEKIAGTKDRNHVIGRDFTFTFSPKSMLRGIIEKWRGKAFNADEEFELDKLLGRPCMLSVAQETSKNDNLYAKVDTVTAVPKGLNVPKATYTPFMWTLDDGDAPTQEWIPYLYGKSVKEVIGKSKERSEKLNREAAVAVGAPVDNGGWHEGPDEIPF